MASGKKNNSGNGASKRPASAAQNPAPRANSTRMVLWAIIAVLVGVVLFLAFKPTGGGGIRNVDQAGVEAAQKAGAKVVDVRTAGEFEMGHIPGAVNVPVDQVATELASWDKNATYVVYCATGARSASAVSTMQSMGFKNIAHFSAGIQAWNGELQKGSTSSSAVKIETSGKPVFMEFYTDS